MIMRCCKFEILIIIWSFVFSSFVDASLNHSLEELTFCFERITSHQNYNSSQSTIFSVETGQHTLSVRFCKPVFFCFCFVASQHYSLQWIDAKNDMARLRIGPFLSTTFDEKSVLNYGFDSGNVAEYEVRVHLSNAERYYYSN